MYLFYSLTSRKRHFLWVTLSVFLLFQDINASVAQFRHVASILGDETSDNGNKDSTDLDILTEREFLERDLEKLRSFKVEECEGGWAIKKNGKCDCAPSPAACEKDYSGMVCATNGIKYKSMCHFSWEVCKENVTSNVDIQPICKEKCKYLRLQGSSILKDKDPKVGLGIFTYVSGSTKNDLLYEAGDAMLYFEDSEPLLKGWNIGKTVNGVKEVMMRFLESEEFDWPQEVGGAEIVPQDGGNKWIMDGTLRLVCIKEMPRINKRFFFLIAMIVCLVVTAVVTTLQVVQMVRGCLYTNLCAVRDEVQSLQPKVRRKQQEYEHDFGKGDNYKLSIESIKETARMINANLARVQDLLSKIKFEKEKDIADASALVRDIVVEASTAMKPFLSTEVIINVGISALSLAIAIAETVYFVVKAVVTTVSTVAVAVAAVFSIIGAIFSIIEIAHSVTQEQEKYRQAVDNRNKLRQADSKLDSAKSKMLDVQKNMKVNIIDKMKDFVRKASEFFPSNNFLSTAKSHLNIIQWYGDITIIKLENVFMGLNATLNFAEEYYKKLKVVYDKQKKAADYARNLEKSLDKDKADPNVAFISFKSQRPQLLKNKYNTFPEFMEYIAKDVLKSYDCYWGYNLADFRQGKGDVKRVEMCDAPELSTYTSKIKAMVQQSDPVCLIKAAMPNKDHFSMTYQIVSYIAKYVLPSESCYYGYDLNKIKDKKWKPEQIEDSKVDKRVVKLMKEATLSDKLEDFENEACFDLKICLSDHFEYIGCIIKTKFNLPTSWDFGICNASTKCVDQLSQAKRC